MSYYVLYTQTQIAGVGKTIKSLVNYTCKLVLLEQQCVYYGTRGKSKTKK